MTPRAFIVIVLSFSSADSLLGRHSVFTQSLTFNKVASFGGVLNLNLDTTGFAVMKPTAS